MPLSHGGAKIVMRLATLRHIPLRIMPRPPEQASGANLLRAWFGIPFGNIIVQRLHPPTLILRPRCVTVGLCHHHRQVAHVSRDYVHELPKRFPATEMGLPRRVHAFATGEAIQPIAARVGVQIHPIHHAVKRQ